MKKITKKTLSAVVTAAMILSNLTALSVSADAATYADWTPGEKNANVWADYDRSDTAMTVSSYVDEQTRWTIEKYVAERDITEPGDKQAFTGARHLENAYRTTDKSFVKAGMTMVFSTKLKDVSADGITAPNFHFGTHSYLVGQSYDDDKTYDTNEYGAEGMPLSKTEYKDYNVSVTLPENYDVNGWHDVYAKRLAAGFVATSANPVKAGTAFEMVRDAIYLAEEQVYDITNTIDKTTVQQGSSINAKAEVLNQVGTKGAIDQTVDWFVVNADRSAVVSEGFEITSDTSTATAVVKAAADAPVGDYVLMAHSDLNGGMYKGAAFTVKEKIDYSKDFVTPEKNANVWVDYARADYANDKNVIKITTSTDSQMGWTIDKYEALVDITSPNQDEHQAFTGAMHLAEKYKDFGVDFIKPGMTMVFSTKLKDVSAEDITAPNFHFGTHSHPDKDYSADKTYDTNEYGAEGMPLSKTEYTNYNVTVTLPEDFNVNGWWGLAKRLTAGFVATSANPVKAGTAFEMVRDAIYLAEEQAYTFNNTTDKDEISEGESLTATAELLNQIGLPGGLSQEFDWVVVNNTRTEEVDGFVITANGNQANVEAQPGVAAGTYYLIAISKADPTIMKGVQFTVKEKIDYSKDFVTPEKIANIIPDASRGAGNYYITYRNDGNIKLVTASAEGGESGSLKWNVTGEVSIKNTWLQSFSGVEIRDIAENGDLAELKWTPTAGKTYVISTKLRNVGTYDDVHFGANIYDSTNGIQNTREYGSAGLAVGKEWTEFKGTISLPDNYTENTETWARGIFMGFPAGTPAGAAVMMEVSSADSVYIAEEQAYTFNNTTDKNEITEGESLTATAELLNQIGLPGGLSQEFDWVVVNNTRTEEVDGFAITANGNQANVEAQPGVASGTYYLIAISKADPKMMKGVQFTVNEKEAESVKIYVAPNGNDSASGTQDAPLATLSGARDKIRTMRSSGIDDAIDVIFAGGTYYFDSTVDFTAEDSGTETAKVTYKAADGEKVVFTGAVSLDWASAQKVTDESILSRLKDEVKDKVVVIDLSKKISMSGENIYATIQKLCGEYEYPELYLDGNEQMIAQWPNGNAEYATWGYVDQDTISYTDAEPSSWTNAKDWWIGGYFSYDYSYMRLPVTSVDTANKQISFKIDAANGLKADNTKTDKSYRWKAFNLLEEIDTPMEWYIDKDNMKLYYYPSKTSGKLEISSLKSSMINLTEADYIGFEGIQFENTRGNAVTATNIESVTVKGCTFKNIGTDAIAVYGTVLAESDKNYWQRQYVDAAYNCEISDCVFNNIGGHAVLMDGGNVDTLTKGNNVIKNNIFYKGAQKIKNYETILLKGCGNEILNNNISRSAFQAIRHYGNDHKIMYNEIYNVIQETDDCGAIYCGRNTIQRGTEIAYNYMHDLKSTDVLPFGHQVAVYLDDGQTGINVHHNIIKNVNKNVYTNGVDNTFNYNTSIDIAKTNLDIKDGGAASNADPETTAFSGNIANPELYYSAYSNLKKIVDASDRTDSSLGLLNTLKGNLCVGGPGGNGIGDNTMYSKKPTTLGSLIISAGTKNPNVSDNNDNGDASVFVNAANQDYRVKGTGALETSVLNESFNIDLIGVQTANAITASEISLAAPYDKENINTETVHFSWSDSFGATSYTVTVATDAGFTDVVAKESSYYNFADIAVPANGTTYYWKVTAHNTSREFNNDWESAVQSFTNGEKITATAVLGSNNQIALSITNNYYSEGKAANVYIAEYDKDGKLLAAQILSTTLPYQTAETFSGKTITLKNADAANVKLFVWDTNNSPLRETVTIK